MNGTSCPLSFPLPPGAAGSCAVFLDRDGVLIEDTGYPDDPETIHLLPGVGEALRRLRSAGWRLVVVSNQSGVARGRFSLARLEEIHLRLVALLEAEGVALDGLYFCPHHPEGPVPEFKRACDHRKPEPGMLLSAARDLGLDLGQSWMIGDKETDLEAGRRAGCRALLVGSSETPDLLAAAYYVLRVHG